MPTYTNSSIKLLSVLSCREIARMLADDYEKRVMIVDTSNEIGGDGDIPHPGIGHARRLQVPNQEMQHKVCSLKFNTLLSCEVYTAVYACIVLLIGLLLGIDTHT